MERYDCQWNGITASQTGWKGVAASHAAQEAGSSTGGAHEAGEHAWAKRPAHIIQQHQLQVAMLILLIALILRVLPSCNQHPFACIIFFVIPASLLNMHRQECGYDADVDVPHHASHACISAVHGVIVCISQR